MHVHKLATVELARSDHQQNWMLITKLFLGC